MEIIKYTGAGIGEIYSQKFLLGKAVYLFGRNVLICLSGEWYFKDIFKWLQNFCALNKERDFFVFGMTEAKKGWEVASRVKGCAKSEEAPTWEHPPPESSMTSTKHKCLLWASCCCCWHWILRGTGFQVGVDVVKDLQGKKARRSGDSKPLRNGQKPLGKGSLSFQTAWN